jgi:hypothetical protein
MQELSCHQAQGPQGENTIPTEVNKCPNPHTVKPLPKRPLDLKTGLCINPCFSSGQTEPSANGTHKNTLAKRPQTRKSLHTADREEGVPKPLRSVHTTGPYPQGSRVCTQRKVRSAKHCSHTETQYPSQRMQGRLHLHL